jgi:predicted transcriptional regulator of viral defense system
MTTLAFYQKLAGHNRITTRTAAQLAGMSISAASKALRRLAAEGLSAPLKKGAWLLGSFSSKPGALVTAAADPYVAYLSGWSALRLHERIQQIPQTEFAVTLGRPAEVEIPGARITLHRMKPELFGGYLYDPRVDGFVASPEKALFDLAYLTAMNRSRVSGSLPETDLKGLRWKEVQTWLRRIPTPRIRAAVERALHTIREQHAGNAD